MKKFLEVVVTVVVAFAVALALKTYVFTNVEVWGSSMDDTLYGGVSAVEDGKVVYHGGDKLLVLKLGKVKKGDIIVFDKRAYSSYSGPEENYNVVKRVVAVAGDHVSIKMNGDTAYLYVNGQAVEEDYIKEPMEARIYPGADYEIDPNFGMMSYNWTVPENCVFVLGDNRNVSSDSRQNGMVRLDAKDEDGKSYIVGKAVFVSNFSKTRTVFKTA